MSGRAGALFVAPSAGLRRENDGVNPSVHDTAETRVDSPLQRIRAAVADDSGLPALGQAVSTVSRMASDDSDTVDELAQAILSDLSLTQRLLRCANSPLYRTRDAAPVTTVSRALMLLGFDQTRTLALSMMLVDRLVPGERGAAVMRDFGQSLRAASVSRCLLQRRWPACAEEAAIAAMFRNVGRILASVHTPEAMAAVRDAVAEGQPESAAAKRFVGRTFDELSIEIVDGWGLPARLEQALRPMTGRPAEPGTSQEWVRLASTFGDEAGERDRRHGVDGRERTTAALTRRFGDAVGLDARAIGEVLLQSERETAVLAQAMGLSSAVAEPPRPATAAAARAPSGAPAAPDAAPAGGTGAAPADRSSEPAERRLLSTLMQMTEAVSGSQGVPRVVQLATDALRDALSADHAVYFARDDAMGAFRPRAAAGADLAALRARVTMPLQYAPDLFHAALAKGADVHIGDTGGDAVRSRLPAWLPAAFPAMRGFLLLPVVIDRRPMGFFYAGHVEAGRPAPDAKQADAIRLLRSQVILALRADAHA